MLYETIIKQNMWNLLLHFLTGLIAGYCIYLLTKNGMLDDAVNFIKHNIFKIKR